MRDSGLSDEDMNWMLTVRPSPIELDTLNKRSKRGGGHVRRKSLDKSYGYAYQHQHATGETLASPPSLTLCLCLSEIACIQSPSLYSPILTNEALLRPRTFTDMSSSADPPSSLESLSSLNTEDRDEGMTPLKSPRYHHRHHHRHTHHHTTEGSFSASTEFDSSMSFGRTALAGRGEGWVSDPSPVIRYDPTVDHFSFSESPSLSTRKTPPLFLDTPIQLDLPLSISPLSLHDPTAAGRGGRREGTPPHPSSRLCSSYSSETSPPRVRHQLHLWEPEPCEEQWGPVHHRDEGEEEEPSIDLFPMELFSTCEEV
jgi:hypothetical protein